MITVVVLCLALFCLQESASAQPSPAKAAALSLLLPGLGHQYADGGSWHGAASYFVLAEAGLWLGALGSQWQRQQTIQSYRTYAATYAGAQLEGKDRRFFITLGTYMSSGAYREDQLRQRRWDQVSYVSDPTFQWHWRSEADMQRYRKLRSAADTWKQRRTVFVAVLAANRVLASLSALRRAQRRRTNPAHISIGLPARCCMPRVQLSVRL